MTKVFEATPAHRPLRSRRSVSWPTWLLLAAIVALGASFSTLNLFGWDSGTGQHPDERFMTDVASYLKMPTSWGEYFDSYRNPLNPRNSGHTFYVYGLLPQTLTHFTAVLLTPADKLSPTVRAPSPDQHQWDTAPQIPNPDLRGPRSSLLQQWLNPAGDDLTSYYFVVKVGRAWSAFFDLMCIVIVFLIGRRLYGERQGLLAALFMALAVLPIQIAHFFTVDSATAFFTLLTIYLAIRAAQGGGLGTFVALGISIGATMACRVTMATLGLAAMIAVWQRVVGVGIWTGGRADRLNNPPIKRLSLAMGFGWLALAGVLSILTFRVLQPDAFLGTNFFDLRPDPRFIDNIKTISASVSGELDSPPSQQWTGRIRFVFALQNMIVWGLGTPLGLVAWGAWLLAGVSMLRAAWRAWLSGNWAQERPRLVHLLPWSWITFYFAWQGGIFGMTMRYYLQLYGLLALFAAWALVLIWDRRRWRRADARVIGSRWLLFYRVPTWLRVALPLVVVIGTFGWAYAFTRIYTRPHSRVTASRWIYANIPAGAKVTYEEWDDYLPVSIDGRSGGQYVGIKTTPYAEDDEVKYTGTTGQDGIHVDGLFDELDQADYVILSSNRVYGSATRLPMRYPALIRYYTTLFNGELGFQLVADVTSYPTIFGIAIPDQGAEEAFSVYDHPRVLIFKKTPAYSHERAAELITNGIAWNEVYKLPSALADRVPTALRLTDSQWPEYRAAGTWSKLFDPASLSNRLPWLIWLFVLELLGLALFPLLFRCLPGLADRGFALAKTLALLLVAYGAWLLGSFDLIAFTPGSVWLCASVLILAGGLIGWQVRFELRAFARQRRAALFVAEGLFLLAFLGFVLIRALNPDLWHPARGGEKPMDLTFLTAVLKSNAFPAYDPWFAGGFINYYYFGFVLVGALVHLTGIVPTTAYNLAVPTLFALTALGAWGVVYNLLAPILKQPRASANAQFALDTSRWLDRERRAITSAIVAAVFVVLLGPLTQAIWYLPGTATPVFEGLPTQCDVSTYAAQQQCRGRAEWAFWDATRLVGMDLQDSTITEFPFFTFLFADLHAHMIALPLALAALGLMVALLKIVGTRPALSMRWRGSLYAVLLGLALLIGALRATNTWDYPTYLGLSVLTLALLSWWRVQQGLAWPYALRFWLLTSLAVFAGSSLLFWPFTHSFATDYAGFTLWRGDRTSAADMLKINGLWLFLLASAALVVYRRLHGLRLFTLAAIALATWVWVLITLALHLNALFLLVPMVGATIGLLVDLLWTQPLRQDVSRYTLAANRESNETTVAWTRAGLVLQLAALWAFCALMIILLTELLVAKGDIGRMNTVFKLGMQSWVLLALVAALALQQVWSSITAMRFSTFAYAGWAWRGITIVLIAAALVYPITATPARLADRIDTRIGPTLDGIAFMRSDQAAWNENNVSFSFEQDAAALDWMREHISGTPIVLEAQTEGYRWGGRISIYTGLPTLLGWPWHETQQRSVANADSVIASRQMLIQQLYSSPDAESTLHWLRLYGIEYVYVGQLERALYSAAGLNKFEQMVQAGQLQRVYAAGETRIYQVPRDIKAPAPALLTTATKVHAPTLDTPSSISLNTPVYQSAANDYAWNRLATAQPLAVLFWLLASYLLLLLGLPLSVLVFGRWRDAGYAWARLIGWLLLGYAVWLPVSLRMWNYTRWGLLWGMLLVLAFDVAILSWAGRHGQAVGVQSSDTFGVLKAQLRDGLRLLWAQLRMRWHGILAVELLFLLAFAFMTILRVLNPDLWQPYWGGEKPFEFAFLNAIVRSSSLPPYDPFFSGGTINYYYYGLFLVSLVVKATGIAPAVAFNLAVPTLFACTAIGAFALVAQLAGRLRYGLLGTAFVVVFGNLAAAFPVGDGQGLAAVWQAVHTGSLWTLGDRLGAWFWGPSRVLTIPDKLITINEFPYWSYLFADLHPHLIAMPITILLAAIAYELFTRRGLSRDQSFASNMADGPARWLAALGGWSEADAEAAKPFLPDLVPCALAMLALGALAITNAWDFPTYGLLIVGALLGRAWREPVHSHMQRARVLLLALAVGIGTMLIALLLYLPFFQSYQRPSSVSGLGLVRDGSPLGGYVLIYGLFLAVLVCWLWGLAGRFIKRDRSQRQPAQAAQSYEDDRASTPAARPSRSWSVVRLALWSIFPLLIIVVALKPSLAAMLWSNTQLLKPLLAILLCATAGLLFVRRLPAPVWFVVWLAGMAWAVSLGIEFVFIRDHLAGSSSAYRMNTVFKFGLQAWILMALAAAAALPRLLRGLRRQSLFTQSLLHAILIVLIGLALVFPLFGTPSRLAVRFPDPPGPTLDGLAFMDSAIYDWQGHQISLRDDADAIRWLDAQIQGTPLVLQSSLEFYRAYGVRIAANTGFPTIVSPLHASEQQDPMQVSLRDSEVQQIYNTTDLSTLLGLLSKYHVDYIYIGAIERAEFDAAALAKFDQLNGSYLNIAYENAGVKIFQVNSAVYNLAPMALNVNAPPAAPAAPHPVEVSLEQLERQVANAPTEAGPAFALAQRYRDLGRLDEAAAVIEPAAQAHPNDVALFHLWGDILRDAGRIDQAEAAYRHAATTAPSAGNYNKLGVELLGWGKLDAAADAFMLAIAADPNVVESYYHLGEVYEQQGQVMQALAQYRAYLTLADPNDTFVQSAQAALARLAK